MLIACATTETTGAVPDSSCLAFNQITFDDSEDSEITIQQIREHNAAYLAICVNVIGLDLTEK